MTETAYVADIKREDAEYIYDQLYRHVGPLHDTEYILSQRGRHWSRDRGMGLIEPILGINKRKGLDYNKEGAESKRG